MVDNDNKGLEGGKMLINVRPDGQREMWSVLSAPVTLLEHHEEVGKCFSKAIKAVGVHG